MIPPLLGWNRFVLEGFGTSCTFDYVSKDFWDRLFTLTLVIGGFLIPLSVILFAYAFILTKLSQRARHLIQYSKNAQCSNEQNITYALNRLNLSDESRIHLGSTISSNNHNSTMENVRRAETRATRTSLVICTIFCSAWGPYALMAIISTFGFDYLVNAYTTSMLGLCTKVAACVNPLIYALSLNRFREELTIYVKYMCHNHTEHRRGLTLSQFDLNRRSYLNLPNATINRQCLRSDLVQQLNSY